MNLDTLPQDLHSWTATISDQVIFIEIEDVLKEGTLLETVAIAKDNKADFEPKI